jgi:hypothetical protein
MTGMGSLKLRPRADVGNLTRTAEAVLQAIEHARFVHQHLVLFVTGIPGAGKTLCGLHAVFGTDSSAAFLTGNLPLVHVIREALARDAQDQGRSLRQARQETESAVQPLIGFLEDNLSRSIPPHEHVIVFDEAQRAWDAAFGRRRFGRANSEAALFLDIMHRHEDWAVIVALVGGGQEINTGEAGLAEWGRALLARPAWHVHAAPDVLRAADPRQRLFETARRPWRRMRRCISACRFDQSARTRSPHGLTRCLPAMPMAQPASLQSVFLCW